jgi:two-component system LytT family response regulator
MNKTAIIVDDERLARNELKKLLAEYPEVEVIGEAGNADEAFKLIEELGPEILFLDIQMPAKTGFDLLAELDTVPTVIFTTAHDEYALKAFEVNALDYLLKPIDPKRLSDAIHKVMFLEEREMVNNETRNENKSFLNDGDQVFVKDGEKCWFVQLVDIEFFESYGNYVRVYFKEFKPLILKSLNLIEDRLDEKKFFRANRKHIVNMDYIVKVESWFNGGFMLYLKNGQEIEVSRRQAIKFKQLMSL